MWENLYQKASFAKVQVTQEMLNATDPVDAFVYMELSNTKEILAVVNSSIATIAKILQGTEMLTPKSQAEATELLKGGVPLSW